MIVNTGQTTAVQQPDQPSVLLDRPAFLAPNPVRSGALLSLYTQLEGPLDIRIWNADGWMVVRDNGRSSSWATRADWPAGIYAYEIVNHRHMVRGTILVIE
ncbi:MAG: T9SS type A sorting domain-containing protein [Saprospiraceae bacterium]|nr:T9SS type A sorting domain-containing protein [Saprospiraceae bacterium]